MACFLPAGVTYLLWISFPVFILVEIIRNQEGDTDILFLLVSWRCPLSFAFILRNTVSFLFERRVSIQPVKVKLVPKCNLAFFCECIWVKPSCKHIITMKEALLRFTVFTFLGQAHFCKLCVHKQCSQCSCSCVETLVILWAKFHVVSSLLGVLNTAILMLS